MLENFSYKVERKIGVLSSCNGKSKEVNVVSFNGGKGKLDLRNWGEVDGKRTMFKGITLSDEEAELLRGYLTEYLDGEPKGGKKGKASYEEYSDDL